MDMETVDSGAERPSKRSRVVVSDDDDDDDDEGKHDDATMSQRRQQREDAMAGFSANEEKKGVVVELDVGAVSDATEKFLKSLPTPEMVVDVVMKTQRSRLNRAHLVNVSQWTEHERSTLFANALCTEKQLIADSMAVSKFVNHRILARYISNGIDPRICVLMVLSSLCQCLDGRELVGTRGRLLRDVRRVLDLIPDLSPNWRTAMERTLDNNSFVSVPMHTGKSLCLRPIFRRLFSMVRNKILDPEASCSPVMRDLIDMAVAVRSYELPGSRSSFVDAVDPIVRKSLERVLPGNNIFYLVTAFLEPTCLVDPETSQPFVVEYPEMCLRLLCCGHILSRVTPEPDTLKQAEIVLCAADTFSYNKTEADSLLAPMRTLCTDNVRAQIIQHMYGQLNTDMTLEPQKLFDQVAQKSLACFQVHENDEAIHGHSEPVLNFSRPFYAELVRSVYGSVRRLSARDHIFLANVRCHPKLKVVLSTEDRIALEAAASIPQESLYIKAQFQPYIGEMTLPMPAFEMLLSAGNRKNFRKAYLALSRELLQSK